MSIQSIIKEMYYNAPLIRKKIWSNYYLKNLIECEKNRRLLKNARINSKNELNNKNLLVSVLIPTYNRGKLLVKRTIPSILKQTYQNFEIIIVGDHCTDDTKMLIKKLKDKRIKFYNLPKRGEYPKDHLFRWMVAGAIPANKAIELCSGKWIAPLDDDDEFSESHIEILLKHALKHSYEMVYGIVKMEKVQGKWIKLGSYPLQSGKISHLSVLYSSKLKFFRYDINSWKYGEAGDWNLWKRMKESGVRIGFVNKIVGKHYLERTRRDI